MQAVSKSDDRLRLEFIKIYDLVKNIAQLLNDNFEAAIVSAEENNTVFYS